MDVETFSIDLSYFALTLTRSEDQPELKVQEMHMGAMTNQEIVIRVSYSSINYKDQLMSKGNPGLVRRFPHVLGIDAVGSVVISHSTRFKVGDDVMVIATPLGRNIPGGLAEYVKVPLDWVMHVPRKMTSKQIASLGTAGFTAALAFLELEKSNIITKEGPVLITGACGGVGMTAASLLLAKGYEIEVVSTSSELNDIYNGCSGARCLDYDDFIKQNSFPLLKPKYIGAIENIGGRALSVALRSMKESSKLCAVGMVVSEKIDVSIMPFILRGIQLQGINAEISDNKTRHLVWDLISNQYFASPISPSIRECTLSEACEYMRGNNPLPGRGRVLVNVAGSN